MPCPYGELGLFRIIGGWDCRQDAGGAGELGSFCIFWLLGVGFWGLAGGNWVRFAFFGCWLLAFGVWGLAKSPPRRIPYLVNKSLWFLKRSSIFRLLVGLLCRALYCDALYHRTGQKSKIKVPNCGINEGQNAKWKVKSGGIAPPGGIWFDDFRFYGEVKPRISRICTDLTAICVVFG